MEKYYLNSNKDLELAKNDFNENPEWIELINELVIEYPCILIASFSDDIEFGEYYQFSVVSLKDFELHYKNNLFTFSLN